MGSLAVSEGDLSSVTGRAVLVKGLPRTSTTAEIGEFFEGLQIAAEDGVYLQFKERRTAGEALVIFVSKDEADRACDRDKDLFVPDKFGQRYVRVIPAPEASIKDFTTTKQQRSSEGQRPCISTDLGRPSSGRKSGSTGKSPFTESVVKLGGLPKSYSESDVTQLFFGLRSQPVAVHLCTSNEATHLLDAFVDFGSSEAAMQAMMSRHGMVMTTKEGMFTLSAHKAMQSDWDNFTTNANKSLDDPLLDKVVRLRGVPSKATKQDIARFLHGFKIKTGGITLTDHHQEKHSKPVFVEFESAAEAQAAIQARDRQTFANGEFGNRFCLLQQAHRVEFEAAKNPAVSAAEAADSALHNGHGSAGSSDRFTTHAYGASHGASGAPPKPNAGGFGVSAAAALPAMNGFTFGAPGSTSMASPYVGFPPTSMMMPQQAAAAAAYASAWPSMMMASMHTAPHNPAAPYFLPNPYAQQQQAAYFDSSQYGYAQLMSGSVAANLMAASMNAHSAYWASQSGAMMHAGMPQQQQQQQQQQVPQRSSKDGKKRRSLEDIDLSLEGPEFTKIGKHKGHKSQ